MEPLIAVLGDVFLKQQLIICWLNFRKICYIWTTVYVKKL